MSEIVDCIAFIVRKAFWSLWVFLSFLFWRLLDLLGLVFNVIACCTIVRLPAMIMHFKDLSSLADWRWIGFVQVLIFITDIPIMLMALVLLVTLWRVYPTYKELRQKWDGRWCRHGVYYTGFAVRGVIVKHFFTLFVDAFCVPSGLLVLVSWRCVIFVRKIREAKDDWERRKACFVQFFHLIFDMLCLAGFLVTLLSWRLPFVIRKVSSRLNKGKPWDKIRIVGLMNLPIMVVDVPCVFAFLLSLVSWRAPMVILSLRKITGELGSSRWQWRARKEACMQLVYLFLDIPCIICAALVFVTLWRSADLVRRIKAVSQRDIGESFVDKEFHIRGLCCKELAMVLIDIFTAFLLICICLSVWRFPEMIQRLKKYRSLMRSVASHHCTQYEDQLSQRGIVFQEFCMIFVDIVFFVMFVFLVCTLWRLYPLARDIKKYLRQYAKDKPRLAAIRGAKMVELRKENVIGGSSALDSTLESACSESSPLKAGVTAREEYGAIAGPGEENHLSDISGSLRPELPPGLSHADDPRSALSGSEDLDLKHYEAVELHAGHSSSQLVLEGTYGAPTAAGSDCEVVLDARDDIDEEKPPLTWSKCMWKVRKSVGMNFIFFFVDLPAIPLFFVLLVTVLRLPPLLSALLGSSNIFLEFAITVYYQTFRLIVDLLFLILFFILIILRPITTWIYVFEDEEHEKNRKLREIRQWVPDIVSGRDEFHAAMSDIVCRAVKALDGSILVRKRLQELSGEYIAKYEKILERLKEADIEDEYVYFLQCIVFWEKKRVAKLMRKYQIEEAYLLRPDSAMHNRNEHRLNHELTVYESTVESQYKAASSYIVGKVPLWRERSGFSVRTREETQKVLIQCLPRGTLFLMLTAVLCCLPLYRAPTMIRRLFRKWYARSSIILGTVKEYGLDILTVLRILVVLIFLYRAPRMIADIFDCLVEKRSWTAVRVVMKRYPPEILEDIIDLLCSLFSWKTPRFIISTVLFGLFMPAELFITVIRIGIRSNCFAYILTAFLYLAFMVFPLLMSLYLGHYLLAYGLGWTNVIILCVFVGALLFVLLLMIVALVRDGEKLFQLAMPDCDYIRLNWYNVHVIVFETLEFLQIALLVFRLRVPMYGGAVLYTASTYVLFSFLPFEPVFYVTVGAFTVWFFICGAPIILENILKTYPVGTFGKRMGWRLAVSVFSNTLFVTLVQTFSSFVACTYHKCPTFEVLGNVTANSSCLRSVLVDDVSVNCWVGAHKGYAAFGLVGLVWYGTTSLIVGTKYGDPDGNELDMGFAPLYNNIINVLKGVMVLTATIVTTNNDVVTAVLLAFNVFCLLFSVFFKAIFGYPPSNLPSILVWRAATFFTCSVIAVAAIVAYRLSEADSKVPLAILVAGCAVALIVSVAISARLRHVSRVMIDREAFRTEILQLEARLVSEKQMLMGWSRQQRIWKRLARSVRSAKRDDRLYIKPLWSGDSARLLSVQGEHSLETWSPAPPHLPPPDEIYPLSHADTSFGAPSSPPLPPPPLPPPPPPFPISSDAIAQSQLAPMSVPAPLDETSSLLFDISPPPQPPPLPPWPIISEQTACEAPPYPTVPPIPPGWDERPWLVTDGIPPPQAPPPPPLPVAPSLVGVVRHHPLSSQSSATSSVSALPVDETLQRASVAPELASLSSEIIRIEKNGRNLLVFLEGFIHYQSYSYSFMAQRSIWLSSVWQSNWTGLLECLRILESNLKSTYGKPTEVDVVLGSKSILEDELSEDPLDHEAPPPRFIRETKEMIEQISDDVRAKALLVFSQIPVHGERWAQILGRVLPSLPVLRDWKYDEHGKFEIKLRRPVCGTITSVGPQGAKLAIGAQVRINQKVLSGQVTGGRLIFDKGFGPTGHKGPVKVSVQEIQFIQRKGKWYIESEGKKVKFDVAMETCQTVEWR